MSDLDKDQEQKALDLHRRAIVIDGAVMASSLEHRKDIERMSEGGITAGFYTVAHWPHNFLGALKRVDHYKQLVLSDPNLLLVTSVKDIKEAKSMFKHSVILYFQDGKPIEDDLGNIRTFYNMGVRVILLTYNSQNLIGIGCCERSYGKLSYFGVEVIEEMNKLGIVIDLSHCCDETTIDAINVSKDPVLCSHSSVRTLCNSYGRNKTDEQIKALAEKDGVIGICWQPFTLKKDKMTHEVLPCTVDDVLDHIDYVVDLVGVNHVGFGSDLIDHVQDEKITPWYSSLRIWRPLRPDVFGTGSTEIYDPFPEGLTRHSETPNLTKGLVARGYSDQEILKILGGNFLRVFETIWDK